MAGARNQRELAQQLGVSQPAVVKWLRDGRWRFGKGPWTAGQVEQIRGWRRAELMEDPAGEGVKLGPEKKANIALKIERVKNLQLEREIKLRLYHRVDECERSQVEKMRLIREALLNLASGLPFEAEVKAAVQAEMETICEALAGSADGSPADGSPADGSPADGSPADGKMADGDPAGGT